MLEHINPCNDVDVLLHSDKTSLSRPCAAIFLSNAYNSRRPSCPPTLPAPTFFLIDELNRTSPKTQAEAMHRSARAAKPCQLFVTRNPIEQEGTYPLPEADGVHDVDVLEAVAKRVS